MFIKDKELLNVNIALQRENEGLSVRLEEALAYIKILKDKDLLNVNIALQRENEGLSVRLEEALAYIKILKEEVNNTVAKISDELNQNQANFIRSRELEEKRNIFELESKMKLEFMDKEQKLRDSLNEKHATLTEANYKKLGKSLENLHAKGNFQMNAVKDVALAFSERHLKKIKEDK